MKLDENKKQEYVKRLLLARLRLLNDYPFYGLLLMNMKYGIDPECETAYTDGTRICFSPEFLDKLSNSELDFILMHEILHVVLKHCYRGTKYNNELFNIACDIVVNSNILKSKDMDINSITIKHLNLESIHKAPNGEEGYKYTAEEVYEMIMKKAKVVYIKLDDHSKWEIDSKAEDKTNEDLASVIVLIQESGSGEIPLGVLREYDKLVKPQIDWKNILEDFMSVEVNDYSFTPPDRRYDNGFFIPDFNEVDNKLKLNLLVAIDASGSMSNNDIGQAVSEIKSLVSLSKSEIEGLVVSFDEKVYEPIPLSKFDTEMVKIKGGGGTTFMPFFNSLDKYREMMGTIDLIVFITDGEAYYPKESARQDIPLLWIINNTRFTPPWGRIARITK